MRTVTVDVTIFNAFVPPANTVPAPVPGGSAPANESTFGAMSLQAGGTTFSAGNQSTNVPLPNPNILWGVAAAATH